MVNSTTDLCCAISHKCIPPLMLGLVLDGLRMTVPGVVHECPYVDTFGLRDVDFDHLQSFMIPQVVPPGVYRIFLRLYRKNNVAIGSVEFEGTFRSRNIMETILMG